MTAYDLVRTNWLGTAKSASEERYNRGSISGEVVSLARFKSPLVSFLELGESVLAELLLAIVNRVEVRGRCVQSTDDFASVNATLVEELLGEHLFL